MPFPSTSILDNFNRADGAIGANWTGGGSAPSIVSNQVSITSGTSQNRIWNPANYGVDQEVFLKLAAFSTAGTTSISVLLKKTADETANGNMLAVVFRFNTNVAEGYIVESNTFVSQGTTPITFAAGDVLGARVIGNTLYAFQNNTELTNWNVSGYDNIASANQYLGFRYSIGGSDTLTIDDFGGGTYSPISIPVMVHHMKQQGMS